MHDCTEEGGREREIGDCDDDRRSASDFLRAAGASGRWAHGRAPGAASGKVPLPGGFHDMQIELLVRWYATGRALPEKSKPRARPRTWEHSPRNSCGLALHIGNGP